MNHKKWSAIMILILLTIMFAACTTKDTMSDEQNTTQQQKGNPHNQECLNSNSVNGGTFFEDDTYIIYSLVDEEKGVYVITKETNQEEKLIDVPGTGIVRFNEWIYYCNDEEASGYNNGPLYRINLKTKQNEKVLDHPVEYVRVKDDYLYFTACLKDMDYFIYRMKEDGSCMEQLTDRYSEQINVVGEWLYYSQSEREEDGNYHCYVYRMKPDGSENARVCDTRIASNRLLVNEDWIYYLEWCPEVQNSEVREPYGYTLCRMHHDGTGVESLAEDVLYFALDGTYLYTTNAWLEEYQWNLVTKRAIMIHPYQEDFDPIMIIQEPSYLSDKLLTKESDFYLIHSGTVFMQVDAADMAECFTMPMSEVIKKYGDDYQVVKTGIEGTEVGYQYENGLVFVVTDDQKSVSRIDCSDSIMIRGVHERMEFDEIMQELGQSKVQYTDWAEDHKYYSLHYTIDGIQLSFRSESADGKNSSLCFTQANQVIELSGTREIDLSFHYGDKRLSQIITDQKVINQLSAVCEGRACYKAATPSCGFEAVEIIFKTENEEISLLPANDSCTTMKVGDTEYYYSISEEDRAELERILSQYGITFPCI